MSNATATPIRFNRERIVSGLLFHYPSVGLGREIEEGLLELIEYRMGQRVVQIDANSWNRSNDPADRVMLLFLIAGIGSDDLKGSPQGRRLLILHQARHIEQNMHGQ